MSTLRELADRQNQHYQNLKDSLDSSGISFRELAGNVRPENITRRSAYMLERLAEGLTKSPVAVFSRHKNNNNNSEMSLG